MQKMLTVTTIDRTFNLETELGAPAPEDPAAAFAGFQDELNQIAEMQRLMGEAPDHPVIEHLSQKEIKKDMLQTVATMLTQYYARSQISMESLNDFREFAQKKLRTPSF